MRGWRRCSCASWTRLWLLEGQGWCPGRSQRKVGMLASIYRTGRDVYAGTLACPIVYIASRLAGLDHQHTSANVPPLLLSSIRLPRLHGVCIYPCPWRTDFWYVCTRSRCTSTRVVYCAQTPLALGYRWYLIHSTTSPLLPAVCNGCLRPDPLCDLPKIPIHRRDDKEPGR